MLGVLNAPATGAGVLTLLGTNFAPFSGSPTVSLSSTTCLTTSWLTDTAVLCSTPLGALQAAGVQISVATLVYSAPSAFTYDSPVFTSLQRWNGPGSGSTTTTVFGLNFAGTDTTPTVQIGATACRTAGWTSSTSLSCVTPAEILQGVGFDGLVTISNSVGTLSAVFTFDNPLLTAISTINAPGSGGFSLTMAGINFGTVDVTNSLALGGTACTTTSWKSDSSIACLFSGFGSGTASTVVATVGSVSGTLVGVFTYDTAVITRSAAPNTAVSGGGTVTIHGTNFFTEGADPTPTVHIGGLACRTASWSANTQVSCATERQTGASHSVRLAARNVVATGLRIFSYDSPVITSVSEINGPPTGSNSVTVVGMNFGNPNLCPTVRIGLTACQTSSWRSETSIICHAAPGVGNTIELSFTLDSLIGTLVGSYTYSGPVIAGFNVKNGPTTGGASVTIFGNNFGVSDPTPTAFIGPGTLYSCTTTAWSTLTSVNCASATYAGGSLTVQLNVGRNVGTASGFFTYDAPLLTFFGNGNAPLTGQTSITVTGTNFGNYDFSLSTTVGSTACGTTSWIASTSFACLYGSTGVGIATTVYVAVASVMGCRTGAFSFDAPVTTSVMVYNSAATGTLSVTLLGMNFYTLDATPTVALGVSVALTTSWTTGTSVLVRASAGTGATVDAYVTNVALLGTGAALFSYDAPSITNYAGYNGATTGGWILTVLGANFAPRDLSVTVGVGKSVCRSTTWSSVTAILCNQPAGYTSNHKLVASVSGSDGTLVGIFTYDAPIITSLSHTNMPSTTGASITIYGTNFGFEDATPLPRVGSTRCATTSWNSESALVCRTSSGSRFSLSFATTIGQTVGTSVSFFTYDAPVVTSLQAPNAPATALASITVQGLNFNPTDESNTIVIGLTTCTTSSWVSPTAMMCQSAPGVGMPSGAFALGGAGVMLGTAAAIFTYDAPALTRFRMANMPTSGAQWVGSITMLGNNFGTYDYTATTQIGNSQCFTTLWSTTTAVRCQVQPGVNAAHSVRISVAQLIGTAFQSFSFDSPTLTYLNLWNHAPTGGVSITIGGFNFGGADYSALATVGSTSCSTLSWSTQTALSCMHGSGTGRDITSILTMNNYVGTGFRTFTYDAPAITIVRRNNSPATAGTSLTLNGVNFGYLDFSSSAQIGATVCQCTQWVSDTAVSCLVPQGAGSFIQVSLTLSGVPGTQASVYSYDAPLVTRLDRLNSPASGGAQLTLYGFNFGFEDFTPTALLGRTTCATTSWTSLTITRCVTSSGQGQQLNTAITINSIIGTQLLGFTYDPPVVTISSITNAPTSGFAGVTISGMSFGTSDFTASATLGNALCATTSWSTGTSLTCASGYGSGAFVAVVANVNTNVGTLARAFTYDPPGVTTMYGRHNAPTSGGLVMTFSGLNLGSSDFTATALLGSTTCLSTSWTSGTTLSCTSSVGTGAANSVLAVVTAQLGTRFLAFSYDAPVGTSSSVPNTATTGFGNVVLSGLNFGATDVSVSILLGLTSCISSSWTSTTSAQCTSGAGTGSAMVVAAIVTSVTGSVQAAFSFDAPVLTRSAPANAPTSGAAQVSVTGLNFAGYNPSVSIAVGGTQCQSSLWITSTSAQCVTPAGTGSQVLMTLTGVDMVSLVGTFVSAFSYDAPVITWAEVFNGPAMGGASVTVVGTNFGVSDTSVTVAVAGAACQTSSWTSVNRLLCRQPAGQGAAVALSASVTQVPGFMTRGFTYDAPVVTFLTPANTPSTGASTAFLTGTNFGSTNQTPSVRFGATSCGSNVWVTDSFLRCAPQPGFGRALTATVSLASVSGSRRSAFTYDQGVVTVLAPRNGPTDGGALLTLSGTNFGAAPAASVRVGTTVCASNLWVTATSIVCTASFGVGTALNANIELDVIGTFSQAFSYDSPAVTSVMPANAPLSGGASLTLTGKNFGAVDISATVLIGGTSCSTIAWVSGSLLLCQVAPGFGPQVAAGVIVGGNYGAGNNAFSYNAPVVTQINPLNGPTSQGGVITIFGTSFGVTDGTSTAKVGSTNCASSFWLTNTAMRCTLPNGSGSSRGVIVSVTGNPQELPVAFSYDAPVVTYGMTAKNNGPTTFSFSVTLTGVNFATSNRSPTMLFGGRVCMTTSWQSVTTALCWSDSGAGYAKAQITVDGLQSSGPAQFTYDGPIVTALVLSNSATSSGGVLTIGGSNFGSLDFSATVRVGDSVCRSQNWLSQTSVVCRLPPGVGARLSIQVSVSEIVGTGFGAFSFDAPIITNANAPNAPSTGSAVATIYGMNFGGTEYSSTAGLGVSACVATVWGSETSVTCKASAGLLQTNVNLSIGGNVGSLSATFTYDAPSITRLHVPNIPTTSGATITLIGTNFGPSAPATARASIGGTLCTTTTWNSATSMVCVTRVGSGLQKTTSIDFVVVGGTMFLGFSYDAPVVTASAPANIPTTAGLTLTLFGTNFGNQDFTLTGALGGSNCVRSRWLAVTALSCVPNVGTGAFASASVRVDGNQGGSRDGFTYDTPVITYVGATTNGATVGGTRVTLSGTNFGSYDSTPVGIVGASKCQSTSWVSNSAVVCQVPNGVGTSRSVGLYVDKNIGTRLSSFSYDSPVITWALVFNGPTQGGALVTLLGQNFGTDDSRNPSVVSMQGYCDAAVGKNACDSGWTNCTRTQFITATSIVCAVPPGVGRASMKVSTFGINFDGDSAFAAPQETIAPGEFTYDGPVITYLSPANGPVTAGAVLTIAGMNFGSPKQYNSPPALTPSPCTTTTGKACVFPFYLNGRWHNACTMWGDTQPWCYTSALGALGVDSNSADWSYCSARCQVENSTLTNLLAPVIRIASRNPSWWTVDPPAQFISDSSVTLQLQPGYGAGADVQWTFAEYSVSSAGVFSYDAPRVTSLSPVNAPVDGMSGKQVLTISGTNFGPQSLDSRNPSWSAPLQEVWVGKTSCSSVKWIGSTQLTCQVPPGTGIRYNVAVALEQNAGIGDSAFSYDAPVITAIGVPDAMKVGNVNQKTSLLISGLQFVAQTTGRRSGQPPTADPLTPLVTIGEGYCQNAKFVTPNSVSCDAIVAGNPNVAQIVQVSIMGASGGASSSQPLPSVGSTTFTFPFGVVCPNNCNAPNGVCIQGECRCSTVPNGAGRVYQERDCSKDYCSGPQQLVADKGEITDHTEVTYYYIPWYKANPSSSQCSWLLQPRNGQAGMVLLTVTKLDLAPGDTLLVYNGRDTKAPLLAMLARPITGIMDMGAITIYSTGPELTVVMNTSAASTAVLRPGYTGIAATYSSQSSGCPKGCMASLGQGSCNDFGTSCVCNAGWRGDACDLGYAALNESFDPAIRQELWLETRGSVFTFGCGQQVGNNLYFQGSRQRYAVTVALDLSQGGSISFSLNLGSNAQGKCELIEANVGKEVLLQYSTDGLATWNTIGTYGPSAYLGFRSIQEQIPPGAYQSSVNLRWVQPNHDPIVDQDSWALDSIQVTTPYVCPTVEDQQCSGHGDCFATNVCKCDDQFYGSACQYACYVNYWHEVECGCPVSVDPYSNPTVSPVVAG